MSYHVDTDPYRRARLGAMGSTGPTAVGYVVANVSRAAWLPTPTGRIALSRIEWFAVREGGEWAHDMGGNREWRGDDTFFIRAYWSDNADRYEDLAPTFTSKQDALDWIDAVLLGVGDYTNGWSASPLWSQHWSSYNQPSAWLIPRDPEDLLRMTRPEPSPTEEVVTP